MTYVNVGAYIYGTRPASKKRLREAIESEPENVVFDATALNPPFKAIAAHAGRIGSYKLSVCGPDPYMNRRWYATVFVKNGKIVVS